jgi:hypothetical protein
MSAKRLRVVGLLVVLIFGLVIILPAVSPTADRILRLATGRNPNMGEAERANAAQAYTSEQQLTTCRAQVAADPSAWDRMPPECKAAIPDSRPKKVAKKK